MIPENLHDALCHVRDGNCVPLLLLLQPSDVEKSHDAVLLSRGDNVGVERIHRQSDRARFGSSADCRHTGSCDRLLLMLLLLFVRHQRSGGILKAGGGSRIEHQRFQRVGCAEAKHSGCSRRAIGEGSTGQVR